MRMGCSDKCCGGVDKSNQLTSCKSEFLRSDFAACPNSRMIASPLSFSSFFIAYIRWDIISLNPAHAWVRSHTSLTSAIVWCPCVALCGHNAADAQALCQQHGQEGQEEQSHLSCLYWPPKRKGDRNTTMYSGTLMFGVSASPCFVTHSHFASLAHVDFTKDWYPRENC